MWSSVLVKVRARTMSGVSEATLITHPIHMAAVPSVMLVASVMSAVCLLPGREGSGAFDVRVSVSARSGPVS